MTGVPIWGGKRGCRRSLQGLRGRKGVASDTAHQYSMRSEKHSVLQRNGMQRDLDLFCLQHVGIIRTQHAQQTPINSFLA